MILELRTYRLATGSARDFAAMMRELALPMLAAAGIQVVRCEASLAAEDGHEEAVLVRVFASLEERRRQEDAFYGSDAWVQGPREAILSPIESFHTVVLQVSPEAVAALAAA